MASASSLFPRFQSFPVASIVAKGYATRQHTPGVTISMPPPQPDTACHSAHLRVYCLCFWLHGDWGPLIIYIFLFFENESTTLMLCKIKMCLMLYSYTCDIEMSDLRVELVGAIDVGKNLCPVRQLNDHVQCLAEPRSC